MISHIHKNRILYDSTYLPKVSKLAKFIETEGRIVVARGKWRALVNGCRVSVWPDETDLEMSHNNVNTSELYT